jgi:hypothetical protein
VRPGYSIYDCIGIVSGAELVKNTHAVFSSSPPVLKYFDGMTLAAAVNKLAEKLTVAGEARRSWPAGGSLANVDHGLAWGHAICSGCDSEMIAV